jgi:hypothetical protein
MGKDAWAAVIVLVQDGSIAKMLADPNPQMSESYAQRLAEKQAKV